MAELDRASPAAYIRKMPKRIERSLGSGALAALALAVACGASALAEDPLDAGGAFKLLCSPGLQKTVAPLAAKLSVEHPGLKISVEAKEAAKIEAELASCEGRALALVDEAILAGSLKPIASRGLLFAANAKYGPDSLPKSAIDKIVAGKISDWQDLGRPQGAFRLYLAKDYLPESFEPSLEASHEHGAEEPPSPDAKKAPRNKNPFLRKFVPAADEAKALLLVSQDPAGMAMTGLCAVAPDGVKFIAVDGVKPTLENIESRAYPFARTVYLAGHGSRQEGLGAEIAAMILDEDFAARLVECGCIPARQEKGRRK